MCLLNTSLRCYGYLLDLPREIQGGLCYSFKRCFWQLFLPFALMLDCWIKLIKYIFSCRNIFLRKHCKNKTQTLHTRNDPEMSFLTLFFWLISMHFPCESAPEVLLGITKRMGPLWRSSLNFDSFHSWIVFSLLGCYTSCFDGASLSFSSQRKFAFFWEQATLIVHLK